MVSGWWGKGAPSTIKSVYPNFNDVLADISPSVRLNVENTLAGARAFRRSAEV